MTLRVALNQEKNHQYPFLKKKILPFLRPRDHKVLEHLADCFMGGHLQRAGVQKVYLCVCDHDKDAAKGRERGRGTLFESLWRSGNSLNSKFDITKTMVELSTVKALCLYPFLS